ncbi:hypothetical protein LCGC14_3088950 [marine sediment metagenome]|uniref:Uncharacterized protein n=1 Tax=marine sediment metagenome TaxID=412755 RepID=A0A0F8WB34_9ZZZZ
MTPTDKFVEAMRWIEGYSSTNRTAVIQASEAFADAECGERHYRPARDAWDHDHKECRTALLKRVME